MIINNEIFTAAYEADVRKVKSLLNQNPGLVNLQDDNGNTPLIYAAIKDCIDTIYLLIDNGGDVFIRNKYGLNSLQYSKGPKRAQQIMRISEARSPEAKATVLGKDHFIEWCSL